MSSKLEATVVVIIALVAIASIVLFIYYAFPETLLGQAVYGENCGCPDDYKPVCSEEGITYDNSCIAVCNGVGEYHEGIC